MLDTLQQTSSSRADRTAEGFRVNAKFTSPPEGSPRKGCKTSKNVIVNSQSLLKLASAEFSNDRQWIYIQTPMTDLWSCKDSIFNVLPT
jgi:hypothetical protein